MSVVVIFGATRTIGNVGEYPAEEAGNPGVHTSIA